MNQPTHHYPPGTVNALLATDHVSQKTREVLTSRQKNVPGPLRFFSAEEAETLRYIAARLIPQPADHEHVDLVSPIDERLTANESDGWRYDVMPADQDAYRQGIAGFHETAQALFGHPFDLLTGLQQDDIIGQVQHDTAPGTIWQTLPPKRFFEDLLAELTGLYFSHPLAQDDMGYAGFADVPNWPTVGLNELYEREPRMT